jgi:hypothetical protein
MGIKAWDHKKQAQKMSPVILSKRRTSATSAAGTALEGNSSNVPCSHNEPKQ